MNITRSNIVDACIALYVKRSIEVPVILPIVSQYCEDKGKKSEDISKLLNVIQTNRVLLEQCFLISLQYFENIFTICKLYRYNQVNEKEFINIY